MTCVGLGWGEVGRAGWGWQGGGWGGVVMVEVGVAGRVLARDVACAGRERPDYRLQSWCSLCLLVRIWRASYLAAQ